MGVQTDVVIADPGEARAVVESDSPASRWDGFTFNGFDHVKLCTLLSLLKTGTPADEFDSYLGLIRPVSGPSDVAAVSTVLPEQVGELAGIAQLGHDEFQSIAAAWADTEEFAGWSPEDVTELLRELGDLAESASLKGKCLLVWQCL